MMRKKGRKRSEQHRASIVSRRVWIVLAVVAIAASFYVMRRHSEASPAGVSAASVSSPAATSGPGAEAGLFLPTVVSHDRPPGSTPGGMVWITGGEFSMGANDAPGMNDVGMKATLDARPIHRVYVDGFFMDQRV